jgi:hypothetical protein
MLCAEEFARQLMTSTELFARCGWSTSTGERRLKNPEEGIPRPLVLADRRFWWRPDVDAFLASRDVQPQA